MQTTGANDERRAALVLVVGEGAFAPVLHDALLTLSTWHRRSSVRADRQPSEKDRKGKVIALSVRSKRQPGTVRTRTSQTRVAFKLVGREAIGTVHGGSHSRQSVGPRVEGHGSMTASQVTHAPSLDLSAHAVRRSSFAPVVCIACHARAQPRASPEGHQANQKVCMTRCAACCAQPDRCSLSNPCFHRLLSPRPLTCPCVSCSPAARVQPSVHMQRRDCQCTTSTSFNDGIHPLSSGAWHERFSGYASLQAGCA